jgi:ABC-type transporter Mla MlaB component
MEGETMPIDIHENGAIRLCSISGPLSIWEAAETWRAIYPLLCSDRPLHIDLSAVEACDGAGIQIVGLIQREILCGAAHIQVTAVSPALLEAMQTAGMDAQPLILEESGTQQT